MFFGRPYPANKKVGDGLFRRPRSLNEPVVVGRTARENFPVHFVFGDALVVHRSQDSRVVLFSCMERAEWLLLMNTPRDAGLRAVQKSGCGKSHQIGNEKRASRDRWIVGERPTSEN